MDFREFFNIATDGYQPYSYQKRFAQSKNLPELLKIPTGLGKTEAVIIGWLWRKYYADQDVKSQTPTRLIYTLPMRVLVEQTYTRAQKIIDRLSEHDSRFEDVPLYLLMGGELDRDWILHPEKNSIFIGTQDMLLSRALNRGYASSRFRWPMEYGLFNNDCLWVMDEVQLMGSGFYSSIQLQAFRNEWRTIGPTNTVWMSATCAGEWLGTVDHKPPAENRIEKLGQQDIQDEKIAQRINASKDLVQLDFKRESTAKNKTEDYINNIAKQIAKVYVEDEPALILTVVNTVSRAQEIFRVLQEEFPDANQIADEIEEIKKKISNPDSWAHRKKNGELYKKDQKKLNNLKEELEQLKQCANQAIPDLKLIHSRFRPSERQKLNEVLTQTKGDNNFPENGRIVVATQVVEAGVDLSADVLLTELAPWNSLVQRFGRLNRYGENETSKAYWVDISTEGRNAEELALPYSPEKLAEARVQLKEIEEISSRTLLSISSDSGPEKIHVLRKKDAQDLFDTTPDLAGNVTDVSPYIRDTQDNDAYVFWRKLSPENELEQQESPSREELVGVPLWSLSNFLDKSNIKGWSWDPLDEEWTTVSSLRPGKTVMLDCVTGGYNEELGWTGEIGVLVPEIKAGRKQENIPDSTSADIYSGLGDWVSLSEHSKDVRDKVETLLEDIPPQLSEEIKAVLVKAGLFHDLGKAHDVFQEALEEIAQPPNIDELYAKSGEKGFFRYKRKYFRHELVSALILNQNKDLLHDFSENLQDLLVYLVAAHHGKVRLSIRALPGEDIPDQLDEKESTRFARGVWEGDIIDNFELTDEISIPTTKLNLEIMELGSSDNSNSWLQRMGSIVNQEEVGPFRLAYFETIIRIADQIVSKNYDNKPEGAGK